MDLCRNTNWISFIPLLLFILNTIFYDICSNLSGVPYGPDHECNINVLKKSNIQTGLNYLPRQRTGWWPVWRPPPPCGEGRSGGTGWSQKSLCWSRQWRLRQKTHRLSRRDYISQFLLSRSLSKTIVLLEIRKWNIASTQRATESTSETGLPVGFGMPWTLRYPLVRYCPFTSMLFWQECLSTLEKRLVKTEYWTLQNRSIVDCTQRYSSLETYAGWEYTHPAHVATSGGAVGIRLLPWIPENSFFQRQKQHIHSYHHISGKNVTFSSTVNKSSNSLSTYKLKKACTCEIC